MPEHPEIETKELQEAISELQEEREELAKERKRETWLSFVGLSTAILAVFAAVGALQSSTLVNEALVNQIKASDTWNEYQASRLKEHTYTIALNAIADAPSVYAARAAAARTREYHAKAAQEAGKERDRFAEARRLEKEAAENIHRSHFFEYSVTLIQVAIALSAISALAKVKPVWYLSLLAGAIGVALFVYGFVL